MNKLSEKRRRKINDTRSEYRIKNNGLLCRWCRQKRDLIIGSFCSISCRDKKHLTDKNYRKRKLLKN